MFLITAFGMMLLVGLIAVVTDIGWMYFQKNRLSTAVNAGWKAGFDEMMRITSASNLPLDAAGEAQVRAKVLEVVERNGYPATALENVNVSFGVGNNLTVTASQPVGLFFARVVGIESSKVAARRGDSGFSGVGVVPLAIPHGVVKDLSKSTFSVDFFNGEQGFAAGSEYILKLGSGGGAGKPEDAPEDQFKMILVPMDLGAQSELGYERAYGAVFWCLKIDAADPGYTPVYWLLGYRGGSFLITYYPEVEDKLKNYGVNYEIINGEAACQAIFDQVNPNTLELIDRPRMAIYSSQSDTDPVEAIFREAFIPYGPYSLPPALNPSGWARGAAYNAANCARIYDGEVEAGVLGQYHWIHMHDEDFTGFSGGCSFWEDGCQEFCDAGRLGTTNNQARREAVKELMCTYCRGFYDSDSGSWTAGYAPRPMTETTNCLNARRRCTDKASYTAARWKDDAAITICQNGGDAQSQCREYNLLSGLAAAFPAVAGAEPKPAKQINLDGSSPIGDSQAGWFDLPTKVQQLKWDVAKKLRDHVVAGGFVFAQCLAPETLDLALWQAGIHSGMTAEAAYGETLAFTGMNYRAFPRVSSTDTFYSTINSHQSDAAQPFSLSSLIDLRCQNHTGSPDTGTGHTSSFASAALKTGVQAFGTDISDPTRVKYLVGTRGRGKFTFMAGHSHLNIQAKRLVLNNVLLGSLVSKILDTDNPIAVTGKQKNNYGVVDPDNLGAGGSNDYRDRFMYGFNAPIQVNDRLMNEAGNMSGPTDQAVGFRITGDAQYPPNRHVIVPITDVPPEVSANNPHNASATTIYDLQGTDQPNGAYLPSQYAFGSSVRVIGFAEFEILDPDEFTRDGSNVLGGDAGDLGNFQSGQVRGRFVRYIVKPGEMPVN